MHSLPFLFIQSSDVLTSCFAVLAKHLRHPVAHPSARVPSPSRSRPNVVRTFRCSSFPFGLSGFRVCGASSDCQVVSFQQGSVRFFVTTLHRQIRSQGDARVDARRGPTPRVSRHSRVVRNAQSRKTRRRESGGCGARKRGDQNTHAMCSSGGCALQAKRRVGIDFITPRKSTRGAHASREGRQSHHRHHLL